MIDIEVSIILTFYNKDFEIEESVTRIDSLLKKSLIPYEIVLCNDGSFDKTDIICKKLNDSLPNIKYITYSKNKGRGFAIKQSLCKCTGKKIVYMDSDIYKTTNLNIIIDALTLLNDFPVVIGNRFHKSLVSKRRFLRKIFGITYRKLVKVLFYKIALSDCEVGFKGFKSEILKEYAKLCFEERWSFDLELLWILTKNKIPIKEIPMDWNEHYDNYNSSVNLFYDSLSQFIGFFRVLFRHRNSNKKLSKYND